MLTWLAHYRQSVSKNNLLSLTASLSLQLYLVAPSEPSAVLNDSAVRLEVWRSINSPSHLVGYLSLSLAHRCQKFSEVFFFFGSRSHLSVLLFWSFWTFSLGFFNIVINKANAGAVNQVGLNSFVFYLLYLKLLVYSLYGES